jgi:hypothetical protein
VIPPEHDQSSSRNPDGGLKFRIAATVVALALAGLSTVHFASGTFDSPAVPIGQITSLDGVISGTVHFTRGQLMIYSGDRVGSNDSSLAINFLSGGDIVLCPHSQLQILAAEEHDGKMLAFEQGGSLQPFQVHPNDVVMTPDWRIQLTGDPPANGITTLQVYTNRKGDLCLSSNARGGQSFRVSQLTGDTVFDITGQSSVRFADGRVNPAPGGCSCEGTPGDNAAPSASTAATPTPMPATDSSPVTAVATPPAPAAPKPPTPAPPVRSTPVATAPVPAPAHTPAPASASATPPAAAAAIAPAPRAPKQRPQDVAGYVRSFFHLLFGR